MNQPKRVRGVLLFCIRFVFIAPVILLLWWLWLLPPYTWLLGQLSAGIINLIVDQPIESMNLETNPAGVLTADTWLIFHVGNSERPFHVADLVNSAIPFIILVLATNGLTLVRRIAILVFGAALLFTGQVLYVVSVYVFAEQLADSEEIGVALGQLWLTAPFVMWIVLAYWDRVTGLFDENGPASPKSPASQTPDSKGHEPLPG